MRIHRQPISGITPHLPFRVPLQGPLRRPFGQFIGHMSAVWLRMHWPHVWQPAVFPFSQFSDWQIMSIKCSHVMRISTAW